MLIWILSFFLLSLYTIKLHFLKNHLKSKISVMESRIEKIEESIKDQNKLKIQCDTILEHLSKHMEEYIIDYVTTRTNCFRNEFEKKLSTDFENACNQIKFNEIEYKKTITKKRKEFNRKNGKNAKPQRVWRYIDEE